MYFLLLITLALSLLMIINTLASILATLLWRSRVLDNWISQSTAQQKSQKIFALRIFPAAAAFVFITAFLLPAYFLFEPNKSGEIVGAKLILLASISGFGIASAFYRVWLTWLATRRLNQNWLLDAESITMPGVSIPVYSIRHPFPVIAVVGALRPKMFIASQIFDSLKPAEIEAAIAHEQGHLVSKDNFKRALMRFCRDLLFFHQGKELESAWAASAEVAADEYAVTTGGKTMALNLATALIKIARMVPTGTNPAMPAGAFLIAKHDCDISGRVRNLLYLTEGGCVARRLAGMNFRIYLGGMISLVLLLATYHAVLQNIHEALEIVVKLLK